MRSYIIIESLLLIGIFLLSIWSLVEAIKNRSRFVLIERLKYYSYGFLISVLVISLIIFTAESKEETGLYITISIALTILLGTIFYYRVAERLDYLSSMFRLSKYYLLIILILVINLFISELSS